MPADDLHDQGSSDLRHADLHVAAGRGSSRVVPQGGSIVFISSYTAYHAEAPIAMYAVSKTALIALAKALAEELGPAGIRVNCVAPGARHTTSHQPPPSCIATNSVAGHGIG